MPPTPANPSQADRPVPPAPAPSLDPATRDLLRAKASQLARRCHLAAADADDVAQDLAAHVWPRLARFDPARADRDRFVRVLVARAAATALRGRRRAARRAAAGPFAAAFRADGREPAEPAEPADPRAWPAPEQAAGRALDVAAVLATLPRRLRRTAAAVSGGTITSAARRLGLSRSVVYAHLAELRTHFVAAGLGPPGGGIGRTLRAGPG